MAPSTFEAPDIAELAPLFPGYTFSYLIAVGGMGAVYRAKQESLDREVAIKVLPREFGADEEFREQFESEAKAMARLNHPNVLSVFDFGSVDGMPYIVMEFVDGSSLHHAVNGMAVEAEQSVELVLQIAQGIAHAHEDGLLHRDIKPANILIDHKFAAKVCDFGLAKQHDHEVQDEVIWGTPGYAAPEILQGPNMTSVQSDIYAIGGILYFLQTSEDPDPEDVELTSLSRCDSRLITILKKCLSRHLAGRYQTADELVEDLEDVLRGMKEPKQVAVNPLLKVSTATPATTTPETGQNLGSMIAARPVPVSFQPKKSKTGLVMILLLAAVIIIGIVFVPKLLENDVSTAGGDSGDKTSAGEAPEIDSSVHSVDIKNGSFEEPFEDGEPSGWKKKQIRNSFVIEKAAVEGADGEVALKIKDGWITTKSNLFVEQGNIYTLEFSLAKDGNEVIKAGKDYKIQLTAGNVVFADFTYAGQPVSFNSQTHFGSAVGGRKAMDRFKLEFDTPHKSLDFKVSTLGIRVVADGCMIYVDDFNLSYKKLNSQAVN